MIIGLIISATLGQIQAPAPVAGDTIPAAKLISTMLARYHDAKTLSANIHMVQTAMNKQLVFDTVLVYERPQKIYLTQRRSDKPQFAPLLVSNSIQFGYSAPPNLDNKRVGFLSETAHPTQGQINIEEMWPAIKSQLDNGGDNSLALTCMISRLYDLKQTIPQLASYANKGKVQIGGRLVNDIEGVWKVAGFGQTGTYQLYVTDDGELVRQVVNLAFAVSAQWLINHKMSPTSFPDGIQTTTVWDVSEKIDQSVDEKVFTMPANH